MRRITCALFIVLIVSISFYAFVVLPKFHSISAAPASIFDADLTEKIKNLRAESDRLGKFIDALAAGTADTHEIVAFLHQEDSHDIAKDEKLVEDSNSHVDAPPSPSIELPIPSLKALKPVVHGSPSVLVVGGTDGSGTRRVVQLLTMLGARFVSEDPETFDIHADVVGGWPAIVNPVLGHTHSVIYDPAMFPESLRNTIATKITKLLNKAKDDSTKPTSYKLAVGGALPLPTSFRASRIHYGFKAPVAMTVVPWISYLLPHVMFLHVVRDGRDIAFSANQGPVDKFYKIMYGTQSKKEIKAEQAIRLWSDWNGGLVDYAEQRKQTLKDNAEKTFDSMILKIEDLVSTDTTVRYNAMMDVAQWIGSDADAESVCCMAVQGSTFMGSHDRTQRNSKSGEEMLASRFGKWKKYFNQDKSLEPRLMSAGESGLSKFGYLETTPAVERNKWGVCTLNIHQCGARERKDPNWRTVTSPQQRLMKSCSIMSGVDYRGGDLTMVSVASEEQCCRSCKQYEGCQFFTYDTKSKYCYLKSSKGKEVSDASTVRLSSGVII